MQQTHSISRPSARLLLIRMAHGRSHVILNVTYIYCAKSQHAVCALRWLATAEVRLAHEVAARSTHHTEAAMEAQCLCCITMARSAAACAPQRMPCPPGWQPRAASDDVLCSKACTHRYSRCALAHPDSSMGSAWAARHAAPDRLWRTKSGVCAPTEDGVTSAWHDRADCWVSCTQNT